MAPLEIINESDFPTFMILRTELVLSLACKGRLFAPGCTGVDTLHIIPRGTVVEGRAIVVSVKFNACLEELRLRRGCED